MPGQRRDHRGYRRRRDRLRRQANTCWLCGKPIDAELQAPHPMSFSADHVRPLSKGGDLLGELRPAHRSCNQRRGNRDAPEQHARTW
jgi:5-methylcytosine-specific restriction endonuclease McrA